MNRLAAILALLIIGSVAAMHGDPTPVAVADSLGHRQMVVVVADATAMRENQQGPTLTRSFINLVATVQADQSLAFISTDAPHDIVGPFEAKAPDFNSMQDEIEGSLRRTRSVQSGDLVEALAEAHAVLGAARAAIGSTVYVITGASPGAEFSRIYRTVSPLIDRFGQDGWTIHGLSLPGASRESLEFLDSVSKETGGRVFELSVIGGFKELVDALLRQGAKGSLSPVSRRVLTPDDLLSSVVTVLPGTRETTLLFFRENNYGSLRLSNPSGFEVSAGDRTASYVMETPNMVIWRLIDPVPGNWKVDARGMEGLISAWEYSSNRYSLILKSQAPLPLNQSNTLVAYVTDGGRTAVLEGVRLFANITTPGGVTSVHEMKDNGAEGDAAAGDGYFSAILPPLSAEGEYEVELELSWLEYNHRISSDATFEAQAFPEIEVRSYEIDGLELGERAKVATVFVHVEGGPYPVDADSLTATLASPAGPQGILEVQPRRLYGEGPAWEYDVFFTAQQEGPHTLMLRLGLEYAGRAYSHTSDLLILSSVAPPAPVQPPVESAPAARLVAPPLTLAQAPPPQATVAEASAFPWALAVLPVLALACVGAVIAYLLTRTPPHGFLYNNNDEPLVDFAKVKRHPILGFLYRGLVRGSELNVPGLEGVVFHFSGKGIKIRSLEDHPTIRVNSEPLIGQATIQDRTWIGTAGKLYTFLLSPVSAMGSASAD